MKVSDLHRKKQIKALKVIQKDRTVEAQLTADVSVQVAKARSSLAASRGDFEQRAAKARQSFPKKFNALMLG